MRRSEINRILAEAEAFIASFRFALPPFFRWSPADWRAQREAAGEVVRARLGWDITDFGLGDFPRRGLVALTIRNGDGRPAGEGPGMVYAEKLLVVQPGQVTPTHTHRVKTEDIINRGGGRLVIALNTMAADGSADRERPVTLRTDGIERTVPAGGLLSLSPGESVTLKPGVYHAFWAEDGPVMVGEVSTVNDDDTDNVFLERVARFPTPEEDAEPYRLLVFDYAARL